MVCCIWQKAVLLSSTVAVRAGQIPCAHWPRLLAIEQISTTQTLQ